MQDFKRFALSRRMALRLGLAGIGSTGLAGGLRTAFADTLADIRKRGELVVATEMQFPPFDISDNGVYKGVDRDLIDAVAKELGVKVSYLDLPGRACFPASKPRSSTSSSRR